MLNQESIKALCHLDTAGRGKKREWYPSTVLQFTTYLSVVKRKMVHSSEVCRARLGSSWTYRNNPVDCTPPHLKDVRYPVGGGATFFFLPTRAPAPR